MIEADSGGLDSSEEQDSTYYLLMTGKYKAEPKVIKPVGQAEVLQDLLIHTSNCAPQPTVIQPTTEQGLYVVLNSTFNTVYAKLGELSQAGANSPTDSYSDRC